MGIAIRQRKAFPYSGVQPEGRVFLRLAISN